jgi:hypothetical protein
MRNRRTQLTIVLIAVVVAASFATIASQMFRCVIPARVQNQVVHQTREAVVHTIGLPTTTLGDDTWVYSPWPNQGYVTIRFGADGHVVSVSDESVFGCR